MKCLSVITSRNNDNIKFASSLFFKREREESGKFLIEGIRIFCDAVKSGVPIDSLFVTEKALNKYNNIFNQYCNSINGYTLITESVAEKLSDTKTPQGVFCVCKAIKKPLDINPTGLYILTDNIQNPDNLGAIVRTAEALGFNGIFISGGCDIYSPKAMRASMGGLLRFPVEYISDNVTLITKLKYSGIRVCATVPDPEATDITTFGLKTGVCLVIGNEGNGISDSVLSACSDILTIKMRGNAESLNASAASSIAMWEICR